MSGEVEFEAEIRTNNDLAIYYPREPIHITYSIRTNAEKVVIMHNLPKNFELREINTQCIQCRILGEGSGIAIEGEEIAHISLLLEAKEPGEYRLEPIAIIQAPQRKEYSLGLVTIKVKQPKTSLSLKLSHIAIEEEDQFSVSYTLFNGEDHPLYLSKIKGIPPEPEKFECVSQVKCPLKDEIIYNFREIKPGEVLHEITSFKALEEGQYFFDPIAIVKLREAPLKLPAQEPEVLVVRKTPVAKEFKAGISWKELLRIVGIGVPKPGIMTISVTNPFKEPLKIKEITLNAHGKLGEVRVKLPRKIVADKIIVDKNVRKGEALEIIIEAPEATPETIVFPTVKMKIEKREYIIPLDPVKII